MNLTKLSLKEITQIIRQDWNPVYFAAEPYLDAMERLDSVNDNVGYDSGSEIIAYFLENAKQWKGMTAREVKAYLKNLIK